MADAGGPSYCSLSQDEQPLANGNGNSNGHVQRPEIYYNEGEFDPPSSDDEEDVEVYGEKMTKLNADEEDGLLTVGGGSTSRRWFKSPLRALIISLLSLVGLAAFIGFFAAKSYKGGNAWHDGKEWGVARIGSNKITMDHVFNGTFNARRQSLRWVPEGSAILLTSKNECLLM
jgi:dipeptidyl aminopeptidase